MISAAASILKAGENSKKRQPDYSRQNRHYIDSLITQGTMIAASILKAGENSKKRQPDNSRHNRHYIDSLITQGTMIAASILQAVCFETSVNLHMLMIRQVFSPQMKDGD